jgi:hypothetical protein
MLRFGFAKLTNAAGELDAQVRLRQFRRLERVSGRIKCARERPVGPIPLCGTTARRAPDHHAVAALCSRKYFMFLSNSLTAITTQSYCYTPI